jgi:hypothetical protein
MKRWLTVLFTGTIISGLAQTADTVSWTSSAALHADWLQPGSPDEPFRFSGYLELENRSKKIGRTWHTHFEARAWWLNHQSFMADSVAERCKPLAQLYFDCYELEARKLQETVNVESPFFPVNDLADSEERARGMIAWLHQATNEGRDETQLSYWRKWMDSSLVATPRLYPPNWEQGNFEFGIDLSPGTMFPAGNLSGVFGPSFGLGYGAGFRVKRFAFDYRMLHTWPSPGKPFSVADFSFGDTSRLRLNQSTWSIGVQLIRKERWSLVPYLGVSTFRVLNRDVNDASLFSKSRVSAGFEGGVLAEWRFLHFYQSNHAQFYWKLLFKAGYEKVSFLHTIDGGTLKLQLGIGFSLRSVVNTRLNGEWKMEN